MTVGEEVAARGTTNLPVSVVAKIAAQAASEPDDTGAAAGGFMGIRARSDFEAKPQAEAEIFGQTVLLRINLGLRFGVPLGLTLLRTRAHIIFQVERLTGLKVSQVDIQVSWVHDPEAEVGPGRGRKLL